MAHDPNENLDPNSILDDLDDDVEQGAFEDEVPAESRDPGSADEHGDAYEGPDVVAVDTPHLIKSGAQSMADSRFTPVADEGLMRKADGSAAPTKPKSYSPAIFHVTNALYFRYSMLSDYLTCPQLMLYKWVLQMDEQDTFFAAITGTAGHAVIAHMHSTNSFDMSSQDILELFYEEFDKAMASSAVPPKLSAKHNNIKSQLDACADDYVTMLQGYQEDDENRRFHCTIVEQKFVLPLRDEFDRDFLFTGTIDQGGFHPNGRFANRDVKFRAQNFRPGFTELKLNLQLSLYTYALWRGNPSCEACAPIYATDGQLVYDGPCEKCKAKIGTAKWPNLVAQDVEILWMRNYEKRGKNEHAKFIPDPEGGKEYYAPTKKMRAKQILNPKYLEGYKIGDRIGSAHLRADRSAGFLEVHIADILRLAGMIRDGRFYRKPGPHCESWCKFQKPCVTGFESRVQDIDLSNLNEHVATIDPFGGD